MDSARGSTCADNAFPPNGAEMEMGVSKWPSLRRGFCIDHAYPRGGQGEARAPERRRTCSESSI